MTRKTPAYENAAVTSYWLENYADQHCTLCGNSGLVDTTATAATAFGLRVGRVNFCICPNGQGRRALGGVPGDAVEIGGRG